MIDRKYLSELNFEELSESEQTQLFCQMLSDIPHDDLLVLKSILPKISRIPELINNEK